MNTNPQIQQNEKIYFIGEESSHYVKIGKTSKDVQSRLLQLQIGNPRRLHEIFHIERPVNFEYEKLFHRAFKNERKCGEWFSMEENTLNKLQEITSKNIPPEEEIEEIKKSFMKDELSKKGSIMKDGSQNKKCTENTARKLVELFVEGMSEYGPVIEFMGELKDEKFAEIRNFLDVSSLNVLHMANNLINKYGYAVTSKMMGGRNHRKRILILKQLSSDNERGPYITNT
jgi:hypothetical protein